MIEPVGILHGSLAAEAVRSGGALALQGGGSAFAFARLCDGPAGPLLASASLPRSWQPALQPLLAAPPPVPGLPSGTLVMGILNVTPDSFSDGGRHLRRADAVASGLAMIGSGAAIVDIGGESTRPGAAAIAPTEEQARILPVIAALRGHGAMISVDTRNASTMRAALDAGADLINDVSALAHDPDAASLLAARACPVVLMHMRGNPATMNDHARYGDVAVEVVRELRERVDEAVRAGIDRARIIVDPGIGFAKNAAQSLELLRRLPLLANLGCRIDRPAARDPGSIMAGLSGLSLPGCILRVHDVAATVQALRVWQAVQG